MHRLNPNIFTAIAVFFAVVFLGSSTHAADWASFRGPSGDGISTAKKLPLEWSATDNVAWKTPIKGQGWSSPVLRLSLIHI